MFRYLARASRFSFAQSLSGATAFMGGPPCVPQAQGPAIFASVMHEQDLSFMHAQTYTTFFEWSFPELCIPDKPTPAGSYANSSSNSDAQVNGIR